MNADAIPEYQNKAAKVLVHAPFYSGFQQKIIETILLNLSPDVYHLVKTSPCLPNWRSETSSALCIAEKIPRNHCYQLLFCTSMLQLAELIGIRQDLARLHKVLYFHDNSDIRLNTLSENDFQFAYSEIVSCMAADAVLFDSHFNMYTFINKVSHLIRSDTSFWPPGIDQVILNKSKVVYYPLNIHIMSQAPECAWKNMRNELVMVWPHLWEFDRNPLVFFNAIQCLENNGYHFTVLVIGEPFHKKSFAFHILRNNLNITKLLDFGYVKSSREYYTMLKRADVIISTSIHEFFGVIVLEAVYCGCVPVIPNNWAYKELYANKVNEMYNTEEELYNILANLCRQKRAGSLRHDYRELANAHAAEKWLQNVMRAINTTPD